MSKRKQTVEGIRSSVSEEFLTYDDGKLIPAEWYSDYVQSEADKIDAMSDEQLYAESIKDGLSRDPRVEARLNMKAAEPGQV